MPRYGRNRNPNASSRGSTGFTWEQVDSYGSASATTWPTGRVPGMQDAIAMAASLVPLVARFHPSYTADISKMFGRFVFAASRLRHTPSIVAQNAHNLNALVLMIASDLGIKDPGPTDDEQTLMDNDADFKKFQARWLIIGEAIFFAMASIEERYTIAYRQGVQRLIDQAVTVEVSGSYGRSALGFPVATYNSDFIPHVEPGDGIPRPGGAPGTGGPERGTPGGTP